MRVTLEGSHLRVDARPARMVSLLKGAAGGEPVVSARRAEGEGHTQALPGNARQATFRIRDEMTVEAARTADFVAIAEDSGRCLVVAFSGEVTVRPRGDGDRFALGAHEALIVPAGKGEPRVVSTDELSDADQADVDAVLDAAADAVLVPAAAPAATAPAPTAAAPAKKAAAEPRPTPAAAPAKKAAAATPVAAAAQGGGGGGGGGGRRKKGKKGRPQPPRPQKAAAAKKAATATKAAGVAGAAKVAAGGGAPPTRPPGGGGGGGGGGRGGGAGGGGPREPEPDETPRDRRILIGAGVLAVIAAIVVIALTGGNDDGDVIATDTTTTTEAPTTTVPTTATITTAPPATTTTARATTTTARATTTTARATTTTAPPADYAVTPKSCVQQGNSIEYTASITNKASRSYDFTISVSFKDEGGAEVAKATANVSRLGPNRTADFTAKGTSTKPLAGTGASCHVTNIDAKPSA